MIHGISGNYLLRNSTNCNNRWIECARQVGGLELKKVVLLPIIASAVQKMLIQIVTMFPTHPKDFEVFCIVK